MKLDCRVEDPEWMDTQDLSMEEIRKCLDFLRMTNLYFGGRRVIRTYLEKYSRGWDQKDPIKILDVASGLGDIPFSLYSWADLLGFRLNITCLEFHPKIVSMAKEQASQNQDFNVLTEDIFSWEYKGPGFDYVTSSLFFHHVPSDKLVLLLKKLDRLAKRGVIISDLRRSWPGYIAVKMVSDLCGNSIVRHDGPLSVRRSFKREELQEIAQSAGLDYLTARNEPFFRVSLSGEKM